jgi:hypothetical protein
MTSAAARQNLSRDLVRQQRIADLRRVGMSYRAIGGAMGVSHEHARQVLMAYRERNRLRESEFARPPRTAPCCRCGRRYAPCDLQHRGRGRRLCPECRSWGICRSCGGEFLRPFPNARLCDDCRWVVRPCANCGKPVVRDRGRDGTTWPNRVWYCNRRCHGAAWGRGHGVPALRAWAALGAGAAS